MFDNKHCMEWLRLMNLLFLSDRAASDERMDWSVLNTKYSASTGIVSASENKEKAFHLLELLHTDSELWILRFSLWYAR